MTNIINNTDLDKIQNTIDNGKKDIQFVRKPVKLHGEWNLDPNSEYQFKTELTYEKGKQTIEIDSLLMQKLKTWQLINKNFKN
jgi:hypothetical protein